MHVRHIDHVGIIVNDLPAATAFFVALGFEVLGEADLHGELVEQVTGLDGARSSIVMLGTPGIPTHIELATFHQPVDAHGPQRPSANTLGIRHIALVVDDIDAVLAKLHAHGAEPFSPVQQYEDIYKTCYIRGPEGIILELAQELR